MTDKKGKITELRIFYYGSNWDKYLLEALYENKSRVAILKTDNKDNVLAFLRILKASNPDIMVLSYAKCEFKKEADISYYCYN